MLPGGDPDTLSLVPLDLPPPPLPRRSKTYPLSPEFQVLLAPGGQPFLVERVFWLDSPEDRPSVEQRLAPWCTLRNDHLLPLVALTFWHEQAFRYYEHTPSWQLPHLLQKSGSSIPASITAALVRDVLLGAHAIHEARGADGAPLGLIHRHIRPHSILVGHDGVGRLFDYEPIERWELEGSPRPKATFSGKNFHMIPPEQILAEPLTPRSDLYTCGAVLWALLAGRYPFLEHEYPLEGVRAILEGRLEAPSRWRPGVPARLEAVALRAMALRPLDRYPSALAMAEAVEAAQPPASRDEVAAWARSLGVRGIGEPLFHEEEPGPEVEGGHPYRGGGAVGGSGASEPRSAPELSRGRREVLAESPLGVAVVVGLGLVTAAAGLRACEAGPEEIEPRTPIDR
jgi:hypothetical protein